MLICPNKHGVGALLEGCPEKDDKSEDDEENDYSISNDMRRMFPAAGFDGSGFARRCLFIGLLIELYEHSMAQNVDDQSCHHSDSGSAEACVIAIVDSEPIAKKRTGKGAEIDTHVEYGESTISAMVIGLVEVADLCGYIGLKESDAGDDQPKGTIEAPERLESHEEVSCGEKDSAVDDCAFGSDVSIGDEAADYGYTIRQRGVPAEVI